MKYIISTDEYGNILDKTGASTGTTLNLSYTYERYEDAKCSDPKVVMSLVESGVTAKELAMLKSEGVI